MKNILFVTTTNDNIFKDYAYVFFDEFEKFSHKDLHMINFVDEGSSQIFKKNYKKIQSMLLNSTQHKQFLLYFGKFIEANGFQVKQKRLSKNQIQFIVKDSTYKYNAIRYSYKVFAMYQGYKIALEKKYDYLIWSDADLRCKKTFNPDDLLEFLPENEEIMSYLGRTNHPQPKPHSETGFLGFNINHRGFSSFMSEVIDTYMTGKIFSFEQWHDCWVFDRVRENYEAKNFKFKNLSGKFSHLKHPYINTNLGIYFDHLKGIEAKKNLKSNNDEYIN